MLKAINKQEEQLKKLIIKKKKKKKNEWKKILKRKEIRFNLNEVFVNFDMNFTDEGLNIV